jgi:plastocyanin
MKTVRTFRLSIAVAAAALMSVLLAACAVDVPHGDYYVTAATKTSAHPQFSVGNPVGYVVNDTQGLAITLTRGTTYTFGVNAPGHPLYFTTSAVGGTSGRGAQEVTDGVTGALTEQGTITFTPNANTPGLLYYQCAVHDNMGWTITVQ